eukprot:scaffold1869_cov122-Cylindrotheca_fusiformis.AAC.3
MPRTFLRPQPNRMKRRPNLLNTSCASLLGYWLLATFPVLITGNSFPQDVWNGHSWNEFLSSLTTREHNHPHSRSHDRLLRDEVSEPILADNFGGEAGFYHGVASGDPLMDRVILWTKYTPVATNETIILELRVAEVTDSIPFNDHLDPEANPYLWVTNVEVTADSDFIAKIDLTGLNSNTNFVFAFTDGRAVSEVGQTRTAPSPDDDVEEMNYVFFSCSEFGAGYFHAYDVASTMKDLDFWVFLGDYIYEYGANDDDIPERRSVTAPEWETVDLQDYRNRYATHHRFDEGLRNLRRRAPVIATWDDHEFANNAYGRREGPTGALNHQETCDLNLDSNSFQFGGCSRDEGKAIQRFNMAARAYMEWMPIRQGIIGGKGVVETASITQIVEWGDLATVVTVDTRLTGRSQEPTTASIVDKFFDVAMNETDVASYYNESSPARQKIDEVAMDIRANLSSPELTLIGEGLRNIIFDTFEESKDAGKPWQIFAQPVVMGPQLSVNFDKLSDFASDNQKTIIDTFVQVGYSTDQGYLLRALVAMAISDTPLNSDSWDGFMYERGLLLDGFQKKANNVIVLGGDSHDSWAYKLFQGGGLDGNPVAVNLNCPAVTSAGYGAVVEPLFESVAGFLGGIQNAIKIVEDSVTGNNEGLLYTELYRKGFVAVKATKETHVAEFILLERDVLRSDYDAVTASSGNITASFSCDASFVTLAEEPGSLSRQEGCEITFDSVRPQVWSLPIPVTDNGELKDRNGVLSGCDSTGCEFDASMLPRAPARSSVNAISTISAATLQLFFLMMIM